MQFNADGELWTDASLKATVEPGALRVAGGTADV
jgi:diacylglycerol kinase family enzyme